MPLPFDSLARIDQICSRFESAWRSGPRPDLGDFLGDIPAGTGDERRALFAELLKVDLEYRLKRGEQPAAAEYRQRFPDEDQIDEIFARLLCDEPSDNDAERGQSISLLDPGPAPATPADPAVLTGALRRYRIERILGQGAFGIVYLAEDQELHRFVALKVAHQARQLQSNIDAFVAEARVLASLDHPSIIPVYDVGRAEGRSYIVTKHIDGSTLSERLRHGLPPRRQAVDWLATLARALQAAHEKGLVHRDVKPSNILIDASGKAFIGDFGLALTEEQFGEGPQLLGTPAYMSPEQARGEGRRVDGRSDVFSLGVVLYEMLTGRPPFQAETVTKTLQQVVEHEPAPPVRLNPTIGRDLDTICLKCLEKRPERRYAAAGELAEDLQRFLDNRAILARPAGQVEKLTRWCRRNPVVAGSLAGVVVIFITAFALVWSSYLRAERERTQAEQREKAERWERYRSNLVAAASAMQVHNVAAARDALESAPAEHRNWEWQYFHHQLDTSEHVLRAPAGVHHTENAADGATSVHVYPDRPPFLLDVGRRAALGPLALGFDVHPLRSHLSLDGKTFACVRHDGAVVLWDIVGQRQKAVLRARGGNKGLNLQFNPDGTRLAATVDDGTIRVWDTASGEERHVLRGHKTIPHRFVFSADGERLASAGHTDRSVRVWNTGDGRLLHVLADHDRMVPRVAFSPGKDRLLSCEDYPSNLVRLWDGESGKLLEVMRGHSNAIMDMIFSPDGKRIATASSDQTIRLWDGQGKLLATLQGHKGPVTFIAFSPDSKRLASASQDQTVRLWDSGTGAPLAVMHGHTQPSMGLWYADGGATLVASAADGSVRLWDAAQIERGGVLKGHTKFVYSVAFHPDGERVASAAWDGTVRLWDATSGKQLAVLTHDGDPIVASVAIHPEGKLLASVGRDNRVRLWNVDTAREIGQLPVNASYAGHDARLAISRQGDLLACGDRDHTLYVWKVSGTAQAIPEEKVAVLRGHKDVVNDLVFSADGAWLASAGDVRDATIRIWDLASKEQLHVLQPTPVSAVLALALTQDGRWLASGCADGSVRLWDTSTWEEAAVLTQGSTVYGLAFTPDGQRLACACANNIIRLWDMATRQAVCDLHGHGLYVHQVAFSPDGTRLVSGSGDGTVRIWDSLSHQQRLARKRAASQH